MRLDGSACWAASPRHTTHRSQHADLPRVSNPRIASSPPPFRQIGLADYWLARNVMMSPFSAGVHSRPRTVLQLRKNHLATFSESVKRSGALETAIGLRSLPARVWPLALGSLV